MLVEPFLLGFQLSVTEELQKMYRGQISTPNSTLTNVLA